MKIDLAGRRVVLSRRNLEALLAKLDLVSSGTPSCCAIAKEGWMLKAEENDPHYGDAPAGQMHLNIEDSLSQPSSGTA